VVQWVACSDGRTSGASVGCGRGRQPRRNRCVIMGCNESEDAVASYKVLIDDNYHFTDESERIQHGVFATADQAIVACKQIVDECLQPMLQPGITAAALYGQYKDFGDDPYIMPVDPNDSPVGFSAWEYAKERCQVLGAMPSKA
jgi:hypothetical protein